MNPGHGGFDRRFPTRPVNSNRGFAVRVYGFATDSAGNHVRIHDAQTDTSEYYPGSTYSALWTDQTLSASEPNYYILDGRASDRWTTIAAAAYALSRQRGQDDLLRLRRRRLQQLRIDQRQLGELHREQRGASDPHRAVREQQQ